MASTPHQSDLAKVKVAQEASVSPSTWSSPLRAASASILGLWNRASPAKKSEDKAAAAKDSPKAIMDKENASPVASAEPPPPLSRYQAISSLEEAELDADRWEERTAIITSMDHEGNMKLARVFLDEVVEQAMDQIMAKMAVEESQPHITVPEPEGTAPEERKESLLVRKTSNFLQAMGYAKRTKSYKSQDSDSDGEFASAEQSFSSANGGLDDSASVTSSAASMITAASSAMAAGVSKQSTASLGELDDILGAMAKLNIRTCEKGKQEKQKEEDGKETSVNDILDSAMTLTPKVNLEAALEKTDMDVSFPEPSKLQELEITLQASHPLSAASTPSILVTSTDEKAGNGLSSVDPSPSKGILKSRHRRETSPDDLVTDKLLKQQRLIEKDKELYAAEQELRALDDEIAALVRERDQVDESNRHVSSKARPQVD